MDMFPSPPVDPEVEAAAAAARAAGESSEEESSGFRLNYIRLIMFTLMPLFIYFFSWLFWAVYGRCKRIHEKERSDKGTATAIIVLFLFYPTIVQIVAKSVNCIEIEGELRLF
mmetsp:Transcript_45938/g.60884  ORF Transcript_45938/g.60884 Transcript_45938/m.60884 type:complete len:113 (+) Transcript_45938:671-1009(+)